MKKFFLLLLAVTVAWPALAATKTATFGVKGWTCGSCAAATRIALKKLGGVEEVKTDHQKMEATVTYDDSKVAPEKMVQAIEKLGYKASIKERKSAGSRAGSPAVRSIVPEKVSFFSVPLECPAVENLGCGGKALPVVLDLEKVPSVAEAWVNHPGTVLAVVWKVPQDSDAAAATVRPVLERRGFNSAALRGDALVEARRDFEARSHWHRGGDVEGLSEEEGRVFAARIVKRLGERTSIPSERVARLQVDLGGVFARYLKRRAEESAADAKPVSQKTRLDRRELIAVAGKSLDARQLSEFEKLLSEGVSEALRPAEQ